jgi:choline dehydrogenase-like flavoprotein
MAQPDVLIIGSGMGGATLAAALAPSGRRILILSVGTGSSIPRKHGTRRRSSGGDTIGRRRSGSTARVGRSTLATTTTRAETLSSTARC